MAIRATCNTLPLDHFIMAWHQADDKPFTRLSNKWTYFGIHTSYFKKFSCSTNMGIWLIPMEINTIKTLSWLYTHKKDFVTTMVMDSRGSGIILGMGSLQPMRGGVCLHRNTTTFFNFQESTGPSGNISQGSQWISYWIFKSPDPKLWAPEHV